MRFLPTHLIQGARKLIWGYLLIQTMQEIKSPDDLELDKLSSWKMIQLLGFPRSTQLLKLQCLERNLLQWRLEWKYSMDCNTSCTWQKWESWDRHWFIGTLCQLSTKNNGQIPHWRKSRIQFVTMQLGNLWQWQKFWRGMCHQWTTRQTFVWKLFQVEKIRSTLLVWCYMTYTSSNVLGTVHQYKSVDGHIWMYIAERTENWLPLSKYQYRRGWCCHTI